MVEEVNNPNAGEATTPSVTQDNAPSSAEAEASSLPSAGKPVEEPGSEKKPKAAKDGEGAPAKAKKEKAPAVEDKPFAEFITQHYSPALQKIMVTMGITDLELAFEKKALPVRGVEEVGDCWQVVGHFQQGQRQFIIGFLKEDIQASKVFCYADKGSNPSTLESFMIDERKVTLDLLLFYTVQRLNGQKWLVRN